MPHYCHAQNEGKSTNESQFPQQLSQFLEDSKSTDDRLFLSSEVLGKLGTVLGK